MAKNQKPNSLTSLRKVRTNWDSFKHRAAIITLAVVFVAGVGGGIWKLFHHPKPQVEADTKIASSLTPDWWLKQYFGSSVCNQANCASNADPDQDGLTNAQEYFYHTDPNNAHTVGDLLDDGQLVTAGFDPSRKGHVTFDQVATPDNIFGDSLLFSSDVQRMVSNLNDISKVSIPLPPVSDFKVTIDESQQSIQTYQQQLASTIEKYFPADNSSSLGDTLKSGGQVEIDDVSNRANSLASDLQQIVVPAKYATYHQYLIALFQLLPQVLNIPQTDGPEMDVWYDKAQEFYADQQRLELEQQSLNKTTSQ